jgi:hypothetical protein
VHLKLGARHFVFSHPQIETAVSCNCSIMLHETSFLGVPAASMCSQSHKHCYSDRETQKVSLYKHYAMSSRGKAPRTRNLGTEAVSLVITMCCNRVAAGGIVTRYGLDGPGIESRWRPDFPHPSRPALGLTPSHSSRLDHPNNIG